jgi:hypothetical protein
LEMRRLAALPAEEAEACKPANLLRVAVPVEEVELPADEPVPSE